MNFNSNCVINAQLTFNTTSSKEQNITGYPFPISILGPIDESNSIWGTQTSCDYITFIPLVQAMCATIWVALFMMCGHGGGGLEAYGSF